MRSSARSWPRRSYKPDRERRQVKELAGQRSGWARRSERPASTEDRHGEMRLRPTRGRGRGDSQGAWIALRAPQTHMHHLLGSHPQVAMIAPRQGRNELRRPKWCSRFDLRQFVSLPIRHPPPTRNERGSAEQCPPGLLKAVLPPARDTRPQPEPLQRTRWERQVADSGGQHRCSRYVDRVSMAAPKHLGPWPHGNAGHLRSSREGFATGITVPVSGTYGQA
jgi:hypothetical protein